MIEWDSGLLEEQKKAASYTEQHILLLAGPGTGKTLTLTRRIAYLVSKENVSPEKILVLTFTRAAAFELRERVVKILGKQRGNLIRVSTLHSFALRQLLMNSDIKSISMPLRIADDWEERYIIFEDLKTILRYKLKKIRENFNLLSADWQTLEADKDGWESRFVDSHFLGAWRQHQKVFGYTLRSELVYQFKRSLEQNTGFSVESDYSDLLVDEYQDLNRCDLAVIYALRDKGLKVFAAGDDDQSIYGFRYAYPDGIRKFTKDFIPSKSFNLSTCMRCDRCIIDLSLFVANLDPHRIEKPLKPREDAEKGEAYILRFMNQNKEAEGVAKICKHLLSNGKYKPSEILILMRSDNNGVFSSVIKKELNKIGIPISHTSVQDEDLLFNEKEGRIFLSFLHLLDNRNDSLALRALLNLRDNSIGEEMLFNIYKLARENNWAFYQAIYKITENPALIRFGKRVANEIKMIQDTVNKYQSKIQYQISSSKSNGLFNILQALANDTISDSYYRKNILDFLKPITAEIKSSILKGLLQLWSSSIENAEQELDPAGVNIMTMHRAKGLTAKAVIIIAAEDEHIPGPQEGGKKEDDERRLLYVSLSRARNFLAVTYCEHRNGQQRYSGRNNSRSNRRLTRFLIDAPISPIDGAVFVKNLEKTI